MSMKNKDYFGNMIHEDYEYIVQRERGFIEWQQKQEYDSLKQELNEGGAFPVFKKVKRIRKPSKNAKNISKHSWNRKNNSWKTY